MRSLKTSNLLDLPFRHLLGCQVNRSALTVPQHHLPTIMEKDDTPDALRIERRVDSPESAVGGTIEVTHLKRHFSIWASIGVNYSISATPLTVGSILALAIGFGGSPMFFYGFLFTGFFQMILCLAMAEIASAMPHSSGQYSA